MSVNMVPSLCPPRAACFVILSRSSSLCAALAVPLLPRVRAVVMYDDADFSAVCDKVKMILHKAGIHATTVQPEFIHRRNILIKDADGKVRSLFVRWGVGALWLWVC